MNSNLSIYDNLGGEQGVRALVEAFIQSYCKMNN